MGWGARFGATWRGKVSGADLSALFAATSGLSNLQQALADRRLDAKIALADQPDHAGQEWRILLAVGPLAAPLWLAESLVGLAQAFYDEETQGQPDQHDPNHPPLVSPYTHDLIAALLAPVEDIIADVTAALADPNHHIGLTAPLHVGPRAEIAGYELPRPPSAEYARGLAKAARRVHTSAAALLMETQATLAKSSAPPDWLTTGLQRHNGSLQGAGARLDMLETRMEPLTLTGRDSAARNADPTALITICGDLWTIADTALVAGQQIADPHLLPESPPVVASRPTPPKPTRQPMQQPTRPAPIRASGPQAPARPSQTYRPIAPGIPPDPLSSARPQPPQPPLPQPDRALPQIAEGAPSSASQAHQTSAAPSTLHQPDASPAPYPFAAPPEGVTFPVVGAESSAEPTQAPAPLSLPPLTTQPMTPSTVAPLPTVAPSTRPPASALPDVGDASRPSQNAVRPTPTEAREPAANEAAKPMQPTAPQRPGAPKNKADDETPSLFPEIG